jgi:hypothetical protein
MYGREVIRTQVAHCTLTIPGGVMLRIRNQLDTAYTAEQLTVDLLLLARIKILSRKRCDLITQSKQSPPQLYYLDHNIHIQYHDMFRL